MKKLSKTRTVKRFAILFSCFTAVMVGAFFAAKQLKTVETNAITKDGTPVNVSYVREGTGTVAPRVGWVYFNDSTGWGTPMFNVTLKDETLPRTAYCIDPNTTPPEESPSGSYNYTTASFPINEKTNMIKLALYIITAPSSDTEALAIQNEWNWDNPSEINSNWNTNHISPNDASYAVRNYQYIMMHALIGSIYNPEKAAEIWDSLAEDEQTWIEDRTDDLASLIKDKSSVWTRASSHQLLGLDISGLSGVQNIAWLEPYSITTSAADVADGDAYVEASSKTQIVDSIDYCAQAGVNYTLQGTLMDKSTGEPLEIGGKTFTNTLSVTPETECSTATMTFDVDTSGIAGKQIVAFQSLIASDGTVLVSHDDIDDPAQTITVVSLDTAASGASEDTQKITAAKGAVINDHIKYCLAAGTEYTITGTLMNKATGKPITVGNDPVTQTVTITPKTNCGETDMKFTFDATGMGGTEIVVFEAVSTYSASAGKFISVVSHEDINDAAQTIIVEDAPKAADTGMMTSEGNSGININNGAAIVVAATASCVVVYLVVRFTSKKKIYGKR